MIHSLQDILVVSDMDNTLLTPQDGVPDVNRETIRLFCMLGGRFTVATGRTAQSAGCHLDAITLNAPAILYGGGVLYDFDRQERIESTVLPDATAKRAISDVVANFPGVGVEVMTDDGNICVVCANEYTHLHTVQEKLRYRMAPLDALTGGWNKVLFACSHEMLLDIETFLAQGSYPGVYFIATNHNYYEIMPEGVTKGTALRSLCAHLNIPEENTIAIGDYYNDLDLMRTAGHSVAVANAPEEIQQEASAVTGRCMDGGVAEVLYALIRRFQ